MRRRDHLTPEQERELDALDRALAGEPVEQDLRSLEELAGDVRATAPAMRPAFAIRLEHDVREGFPVQSERPPLHARSRPARRRTPWLLPAAGSLAAAAIALVVVFAGVPSGGGAPTSSDERAGAALERPPEPGAAGADAGGPAAEGARPAAAATDERSAAPAGAGSGSIAPGVPPLAVPNPAAAVGDPAAARRVQRGASLVLQTEGAAFDAATAQVSQVVERFDGVVASSQVNVSDQGGATGTFDLRIPTGKLDSALAALARLGRVTERNQSLVDVTGSYSSTRERLTDARAERRGLLRSLERATTQGRIDSLKARLRSVAGRITSLERQLASLRRRSNLATVSLVVRAADDGPAAGGGGAWTPRDAARDALRVLEVVAGIALVGLAVLLPLGLLVAAAVLTARLGRRRRREAALDGA